MHRRRDRNQKGLRRGVWRFVGLAMIGTGVAAALPFQRAIDQSWQTAGTSRQTDVIWRGADGQLDGAVDRSAQGAELFIRPRTQEEPVADSRIRKPASLDVPSMPPQLPVVYESPAERSATAAEGDEVKSKTAVAKGLEPRVVVHRVVDGDTLELLAARYLGHGDRWPEIFEQNHDLLQSPDILHIGAELLIAVGPVNAARVRTASSDSTLKMVPIESERWTPADTTQPD